MTNNYIKCEITKENEKEYFDWALNLTLDEFRSLIANHEENKLILNYELIYKFIHNGGVRR